MARIAHLTSAHPAQDVRIFEKMARSARAAGHTVVLIAQGTEDREVDGVQLLAVPAPRARHERMTRTVLQLARRAIACQADIYHFHDPELMPLAWVLSAMGRRVVYDVHEDMPRNLRSKTWLPAWAKPLVAGTTGALEWVTGRLCAGVVAATPTIAARFPTRHTVVAHNYPILSELVPATPTPYGLRPPVALYVGAISVVRGARVLAEAARLMQESAPAGSVLRLAGASQPATLVPELCASSPIEWSGLLDRSGVVRTLDGARVGVMVGQPTQAMREAYPIKIFEYMAAGLPMVLSDFPVWRGLLGGVDCACFVDPTDAGAVARAISGLLRDPVRAEAMGRAGSEFVHAQYAWRTEAETVEGLYRQILRRA